jgi:hypothetical protein
VISQILIMIMNTMAGPYYGIRMRAADPRYITESNDINRGDVLLTMAQVRQLIDLKANSEEEIATVWLTTSGMGFSLTAEPNEITCPQDAREGKSVIDSWLLRYRASQRACS